MARSRSEDDDDGGPSWVDYVLELLSILWP